MPAQMCGEGYENPPGMVDLRNQQLISTGWIVKFQDQLLSLHMTRTSLASSLILFLAMIMGKSKNQGNFTFKSNRSAVTKLPSNDAYMQTTISLLDAFFTMTVDTHL